jgi:hypothetical protein
MARSTNSPSSNLSSRVRNVSDRFVRDVLAPIVDRPYFPTADEWDDAVSQLTRRTLEAGRGRRNGRGRGGGGAVVATGATEDDAEVERRSRDALFRAYETSKGAAAPVMEVEVQYGALVRDGDYAGAVRVVTAFLDSSQDHHRTLFPTQQRWSMARGRLHCLRAAALEKVGAHRAAMQDCSDGAAALANVTTTKGNGVDEYLLSNEMIVLESSALQHLGADASANNSKMQASLRKAIGTYGRAGNVAAGEAVERQLRTIQRIQRAWDVYNSPMFSSATDVAFIAKRRTCPGSVQLLLVHLEVLCFDGLYDRAANECERWACEAVKLDGVFGGSIAGRHPYPKAWPAAVFLRRGTFEGQSRTSTDTALNPNEVGEAVLRMPTKAVQFYLLALWMEDRGDEVKGAVRSLKNHGVTIALADGTDVLHAPSEALPIYLLSLRSMTSCYHQVKHVILKVRKREEDDKDEPLPEGDPGISSKDTRSERSEHTKPAARLREERSTGPTENNPSSNGARQGVMRSRHGTIPATASSSEGMAPHVDPASSKELTCVVFASSQPTTSRLEHGSWNFSGTSPPS